MRTLSVKEAQAIINDVQLRNGGVNLEVVPKDQVKALRNLQTIAGSSIEHVAEDLYDADTGYIFELIQDAEDNRYNIAERNHREPPLHFTLHQDRLTVDSNEDGFTKADVHAICSIHRSSKKQQGGYIGHKGIGFKSRIQNRIQSLHPAPQKLPSSIRTRITLWVLDSNNFSTRARELKEIPPATLLLFLRQLCRLTIEIPTLESRVTYEREEDMTASLTTLKKQSGEAEKKKIYYTQKQTLTDLPAHHTRQEQHASQYVYSFLLMRNEGFNVVHLCPRNYAAVRYFCKQGKTKVLFCFGNSILKRPVDLHNLSSGHCDWLGKPLLDGIQPTVYLSLSYSCAGHAENLRELGVTRLPTMSFLDRLTPYLQGKQPKYMDPVLDDDWHTRVADFLVRALRNNREGSKVHKRIMAMPLGNPIPKDLKKILLVGRQVFQRPSRRELFELLEVPHCKPDCVIKAILRRYDQHGGQADQHLRIPPSPRFISYTMPIVRLYPRGSSVMDALGNSGFNGQHQSAGYSAELTPNVISLLKDMKVPCLNQSKYRVRYTYYPSKEMQRLVADANVKTDVPYFLNPTIEFFFDIIECLVHKDELDLKVESAFFTYTPICKPKTGQRSTSFRELEDCYWDGHPCLSSSLAQYPQYTNNPHVAHLFRNVLRIPDADIFAYLSQIDILRIDQRNIVSNISIDDLGVVDGLVAKNITSHKDSESHFARLSLIYFPAESRWLAPADCLWTETPRTGAQSGISKVYSELENFFQNHLKLRTFLSESPVDIVKITSTLHKMRSVELYLSNREDLLNLRIFPVVMPGGPVKLHPLLEFLGLQDRYTSTAVKERTVVEDPAEGPSYTETGAFQSKSRHIHRIKPCVRPGEAEKAAIYLSGGFKTILELQLNEVAATVQSDSGLVHICGSNRLCIYIPRDTDDRKRCYSLHLPQALVRYFALRDREAPLTFQLVFLTPGDFIDDLLDAHAIIRSSPDFRETYMLDNDTYTPRSSYESIEGSEERTVSYHRAVLPTPQPFTVQYVQEVYSSLAASPVLGRHYLRVLDDIIKLSLFGVRSGGQIEHDIKIGAIGELFVQFTRANWRSTIRRKVSDHPEYPDLAPWNGAKTVLSRVVLPLTV
ncbi:uncharacterized protein BDW70DRAFT_153630 [Aspergillus foveolatus]|uniref:uncharacterized protein n=1 Tax=Aspergillus foveolatus TaxID=210207 RepID=UPI003CCD8099